MINQHVSALLVCHSGDRSLTLKSTRRSGQIFGYLLVGLDFSVSLQTDLVNGKSAQFSQFYVGMVLEKSTTKWSTQHIYARLIVGTIQGA